MSPVLFGPSLACLSFGGRLRSQTRPGLQFQPETLVCVGHVRHLLLRHRNQSKKGQKPELLGLSRLDLSPTPFLPLSNPSRLVWLISTAILHT